MNVDRFVCFDTETTGLGANARIIDLALVFFEKGIVKDVWASRFYPDDVDWADPKVKEALAVNKLSVGELVDAPQIEEVIDCIVDHMWGYDVWVAHNAPFDIRMINQELDRLRKPALPFLSRKLIDTWMLDRKCFPEAPHHRLGDACEHTGVELIDAHASETDAQACGEVLMSMIRSGLLPDDVEALCKVTKTLRDKQDQRFNNRASRARA